MLGHRLQKHVDFDLGLRTFVPHLVGVNARRSLFQSVGHYVLQFCSFYKDSVLTFR